MINGNEMLIVGLDTFWRTVVIESDQLNRTPKKTTILVYGVCPELVSL
jgi:hypothetical protein